MRQFLPLANVSDIHYELVEWYVTGEDGQWRTLNANTSSLIEIILPSFRFASFCSELSVITALKVFIGFSHYFLTLDYWSRLLLE